MKLQHRIKTSHLDTGPDRPKHAKNVGVPIYAIHCIDKPYSQELRAETRPAHLKHLRAIADQVLVAGALLDDAGEPIGSMLLIEFPDRNAALRFTAEDPYSLAGLFASVAITAWRQAPIRDEVLQQG